jgi:type IV pilus assembly protein PilM
MAGGPTVGLDIGTHLIKAVEVRRGSNGAQVVALGVAPTPQAAFENGVIVDAHMLGQAVKELLRQSGISAKQCVSSVSGQSVVVRVIPVPKMSVTELAETMKWEVQRQIPFPADEVIVDYQPIERPGDPGDGQNMEVLLAVAQQDMIDRHVEMLFAAGLKPVAIDVEPTAASRCLLELGSNGVHSPGHAVAIVNLGASNTDIGIFRDGLPAFNRTLPLAGDNLTHAISTALQVDLATAEDYKRKHGEVLLGQGQPSAAGFGAPPADFGFVDFTAPPAPPTGPATPSGGIAHMPFDFSTPGETPPPAPAEPRPFDLSGNPIPPTAPDLSGPASVPGGGPFVPPSEPGFIQPEGVAPPPPTNLPAPVVGTGDPTRDTLTIQIFNAMSPVLIDLIQELRRSIEFYRGQVADGQIHEMLLIGGTANLPNLAPYLEAELGIPTRVADPLKIVQVTSKNFSQSHLEELASLFPVSIGLGAYQMAAASAGGKKR